MTIKVPIKSLKFGAWQVAVKRISKTDAKSNWGLYFPSRHEIHLLNEYPTKQKAAEVLLHESGHVILEERGIALGKMEENLIAEFTKGQVAFFRDNPQALKWLVRCCS